MTLHVGHEPALTPDESSSSAFDECGGCGERRRIEDLPHHGSRRYCRENGCLLTVYLEGLEADRARWTGMQLATLREEAMFLVEACDREHSRREEVAKMPRIPFNGRSPSLSPAASAIAAACATAAGQPSCVYCRECGHLHASGPCPCACKQKIAAGVSL